VNSTDGPSVRLAVESPLSPEAAEMFTLSDAYAASLYPAESNHMVDAAALMQPNVIFCMARQSGRALGCGAVVLFADNDPVRPYAEIKRMWVHGAARGMGLGAQILAFLEQAAAGRGVRTLRLETGVVSHEARRLYEKCGYSEIGPFGAYSEDPLSVFYEKRL
jgi:putative acetyltransferase